MRRFIVIFLLLLLPIQVLAESVEDLRAAHHSAALLADAANEVSTNADTVLKHSPSSPDASNFQQPVHADISDSVSSAALYVRSPLSAEFWPALRLVAILTVYLPVIKPPII